MATVMHDFKVGDKFQMKEPCLDMTINKDYEVLEVEDNYVVCLDDVNEKNDIWIGNIVPSFYKENKAINEQIGGTHYRDKAIQPIEYILANYLGFCEGNIIKYVSRYKDKNGLEDLKKAKHYLEFLIEEVEKEG